MSEIRVASGAGSLESRLVPIRTIVTGRRRRDEYGDIEGLAKSIARHGLIHPIVLDDQDRLVAGGRRLKACELLGFAEIEARRMGNLSEAELREIELEENLRRKDLTPLERSKNMVALAGASREAAREDSKHKDETCSTVEQVSTPQRGPSRESGSYRDVQERTGIPVGTIHRAEKHVEAVERYPELKDFPQTEAITAAKTLDAMPEEERERKRELTRAYDQATVAEIAGKPPMPAKLASQGSPEEARIKKAADRWNRGLYETYRYLTSIRDLGGIAGLTERWPRGRKEAQLAEIVRIKEEFERQERELREALG